MNIQSNRKKLSVPRPWGHEQFLKEMVGKRVETWGYGSQCTVGKLKSFDRYTVLIEQEMDNGTTREFLIFKSAITQMNEAL